MDLQTAHGGGCAGQTVLERVVQRAIGVEPGDAVARGAVNRGKSAADHNLPVALDPNGIDCAVGVGAERGIHRAISVQAGVVSWKACAGETTADDDLVIALRRQRQHRPGDDIGGDETAVQGTTGIQSGNPGASGPVDRCEIAADDDAAVRLHRQAPNGAGNADAAVEKGRVQRTVGEQTRQMIPGAGSIDRGKSASKQNASIRLDRCCIDGPAHRWGEGGIHRAGAGIGGGGEQTEAAQSDGSEQGELVLVPGHGARLIKKP